MKELRAIWAVGLAAVGIGSAALLNGCGGDNSTAVTAAPANLTCDDTMKTLFVPDAQTSVLLVKSWKKGDALLLTGTATASTPIAANDMCLVKLLVGPGNPGPASAPSTTQGIGIEIWLPSPANWNNRLHLLGGAGMAGGQQTSLTAIVNAPTAAPWTVAGVEGAVAATTDTGHVSGGGDILMNPDGTVNTLVWSQFSEQGIHQMTLKTKALALAYYGKAQKYTYWHGGSTGGRQGMKQAQTFPNDFDGIVATQPAINWARFSTASVYPQVVYNMDLGGVAPTTAQLNAVSLAAISACDVVGGQHLGYPLDPSQCTYDPTTDPSVICVANGGTNATANCVTPAIAKAINKVWYGQTVDGSVPSPSVDNGGAPTLSGVHRWFGMARGTSLTALASATPSSIDIDLVALELQDPTWSLPTFLNATSNGTNRWKNLTYDQLSDAYDRGVALQGPFANIDTNNPDLSAYKAHGGKIISEVGLNDNLIFQNGVIYYYNQVVAQLGGLAAVQSFFVLYTVPGMGHFPANGTANPNANPPIPLQSDTYALLTAWVESGTVPGRRDISSPVTPTNPVANTAPICVYPLKRAYVSGNLGVTASYTCS
jgi:hypothetical protein